MSWELGAFWIHVVMTTLDVNKQQDINEIFVIMDDQQSMSIVWIYLMTKLIGVGFLTL